MYLKVSLSDFLTLFSARTTKWFFTVRPDYKLIIAAFVALGASTALTARWPTELNEKHLERGFLSCDSSCDKNTCLCGGEVHANEFNHIFEFTGTRMNGVPNFVLGTTWLYVFIWWMVQDVVKYALYIVLLKFDVLQVKTGMYTNVRGDEAGVSEVTDEVANAAVGRVEGKLVNADVRDTHATLNTLEKTTQDTVKPKLADLEAAIKTKDDKQIKKASEEVSASITTLDKNDAEKLKQHMLKLKADADRAAKATGSLRKK